LLATPIPLFQRPSDATRQPLLPPTVNTFLPERFATSNYCGNAGSFGNSFEAPRIAQNELLTNGILGRDSTVRLRDVTDGASNTFIAGEVIHYNFHWDPTLYGHFHLPRTACCTLKLARCGNRRLNPGPSATTDDQREGFSSLHAGGAHFALCDGSVRFVSENIDSSSRQWTSETMSDPFDRANAGANYRTYQRLCSRNDGIPTGEF
jgi:prepilin-type processing-associated H-X9-DG protein